MKPVNKEVFRAYDVRGIVDRDFDEEWVEMLGRACAGFFSRRGWGRAVVGYDCRHSSPAYRDAIAAGLLACGIDVVSIGMVPTPVFYYAVKKLDLHAGVMITASHNPGEFNGFKIWGGESTIHTAEIDELYEIMKSGDFPVAGSSVASSYDVKPDYISEISRQISLKRPVKVVIDGGNGAGGLICAELLEAVGANVIQLYCEPDGSFPNHHPDPTVERNNIDLKATVLREKADMGIGLDGDADRIGVLDEAGNAVYGDKLLAIFASAVLRKHPGARVVGEVKCSHLLYNYIEKTGGVPVMSKTGHSLIKALMRETGAILSGEMSGHMFFADRYYGFDDAIYAAARVVEIVSERGVQVSRILTEEDWPKTFNTPEIRRDCPEKIKFAVVEKALGYFKERYRVIDVDGARIVFPDGWGLIRASNTQPILVLRFEAETAERLEEIRKIVEEPLSVWIEELGGMSA